MNAIVYPLTRGERWAVRLLGTVAVCMSVAVLVAVLIVSVVAGD